MCLYLYVCVCVSHTPSVSVGGDTLAPLTWQKTQVALRRLRGKVRLTPSRGNRSVWDENEREFKTILNVSPESDWSFCAVCRLQRPQCEKKNLLHCFRTCLTFCLKVTTRFYIYVFHIYHPLYYVQCLWAQRIFAWQQSHFPLNTFDIILGNILKTGDTMYLSLSKMYNNQYLKLIGSLADG